MSSFEVPANVHIEARCKVCGSEIEIPYSKEELLSGESLKFTCTKCGNVFYKETASEIKKSAVDAFKEAFKKNWNKH